MASHPPPPPPPPVPVWFQHFLEAAFYLPCMVHNKKSCNLYCTDCDCPICPDCRDDEESHCRQKHHLILQVVRSSYQIAVQIDGANGIGRVFEGQDDIQVYRANKVRIFYLHSRGPSRAENGRVGPYLCEVCQWPLLEADKRFCSISCRVKEISDLLPPPPPPELSGRPQQSDNGGNTFPTTLHSGSDDASPATAQGELSSGSLSNNTREEQGKRRHRRKAKFPRRSPLF